VGAWKSWKYKNLTYLFISLSFAFLLSLSEIFHTFLLNLGGFGYLGAFITGMFFVSTFTVATAAVVLFILAETLSPLEIGLLGGLGAVFGDFLIFRFVRNNLIDEIELLYIRLGGNHFNKMLHTKFFSWMLPVIGAIIIASPLPDEIGVSLMGISKLKFYQFLLFSFILNAIGIFLVVSAATIIKP